MEQGRFGEALEAFDRALKLKPGDGEVHFNKAETLCQAGDGWPRHRRVPAGPRGPAL